MKRLVLLLAVLSLPAAAWAQTSAIPANISYQGRVTDVNGNAIGDPTPVNREIIFRIYDNAVTGNRLYSEKQTVTIAKGEFSVLIGGGTPVNGETNAGTLAAIFTAKDRYLGITVDDGTAAVDPEISPRQQLVSTPFAFRATVAESVLGLSILTAMLANDAVTSVQLADSAVTNAKLVANSVTTAKLADASITEAKIAGGSVTSAKIADGTIATVDFADGAVTTAKLGSDVGKWTVSGANIWRGSNVGIATASPTALLSLGGNPVNSKILVMDDGNAGNNMGFGSQANQFRFHVGNSAARFSFLDAPGGNEVFTVQGGGNVGLGVTNPVHQLTVFNTLHPRMSFQQNASGTSNTDGFHVGAHATSSYLWNYEATALQFGTSGIERVRIEADGRMGFNGTGDGNMAFTMRSMAQQYILTLMDRNGAWAFSFLEDGTPLKKGGGTGWGSTSDRRLKKNINSLSGSLERLLQLRSVNFEYKDEQYGKGPQTGFVAQEVQKVFPDWVKEGPGGFLIVAAAGFESHTIQAFRELRAEKDAQIAALQAELKELKSEGAQRLDALERRMNAATITANSPR